MESVQFNTPVKKVSLVESVYQTIVEAIVSGQLAPGTIVNSVAIAEQLGVSRTPVKESIRLLVRDGLLRQESNHKAQVAKFSPVEIREIYEVRLALESKAAERAATRISDDALRALRFEAERLRDSRSDVDWAAKAIDYDIRFHAAIAQAADNSRLGDEINRYRLLVRSFCLLTGREAILEQALNEHILILDALASRKPSRARKAMESHILARLKATAEQVKS
ncbi:GntR family transcriptional regulator [Roseiconus lacunae]|uniref:GntR family transcriptional regulator n=1 Tax=Roseiconus lacunae TaxID=2605694 RepID=UPI0011F2B7A8|nr:GntR family transcriptional regulator [Roseiconus lacunae]